VKGRLDMIEARLDEIQGEIRSLSLRLPPAVGETLSPARDPSRPPIPPPVYYPESAEPQPERVRLVPPVKAPRPDSRPAPRAEPRFGPR
jgi:hypothetical protein